MTRNNYGEWHIDHIIPCAAFNMSNEIDQRICFHYTNLQPLWAVDNIRKSDNVSADAIAILRERLTPEVTIRIESRRVRQEEDELARDLGKWFISTFPVPKPKKIDDSCDLGKWFLETFPKRKPIWKRDPNDLGLWFENTFSKKYLSEETRNAVSKGLRAYRATEAGKANTVASIKKNNRDQTYQTRSNSRRVDRKNMRNLLFDQTQRSIWQENRGKRRVANQLQSLRAQYQKRMESRAC